MCCQLTMEEESFQTLANIWSLVQEKGPSSSSRTMQETTTASSTIAILPNTDVVAEGSLPCAKDKEEFIDEFLGGG